MSKAVTNLKKLDNIIDIVADFGADPTGVTDATIVINAALTAGAGGKVFFPKGTYACSGTLNVLTGTTVEFAGSGATIMYTGSSDCFNFSNANYITLIRPFVNMVNAAVTAVGLHFYGCWFVKIDQPIIWCTGNGTTGSTAIKLTTSALGSLGIGCYMFQIFNPYFDSGGSSGTQQAIGIATEKQVGDTVNITHLSVYDGWSSNLTYPLWIRNCNTFNIYGFTPELCVDGINVQYSSDGMIHYGEAECTGYAVNFPDNSCNNMTVFAPSQAGTAGVNTTNYTPNMYLSNEIRLNGSGSGANNNYNYGLTLAFNYSQSLVESAQGGGVSRVLRTFDDVNRQRLSNVFSLSSTDIVGTNLRGTLQFYAATTRVYSFVTVEPDANYFIAHSGNAAGYCWVTNKLSTGFTMNCSVTNSNTMDWILIR